MSKCIMKDCNIKYKGLGYCTKHYQRFKKWGNPLRISIKGEGKKCIINNCKNKHYGRDLCKYHYSRNYRKENPEKGLKLMNKYLSKISDYFSMNIKEYLWALELWSLSVRKRDNNKCQICGNTKDLNAHHIIHKIKYPQLSLNLNNGITLCIDCHYQVHDKKLI